MGGHFALVSLESKQKRGDGLGQKEHGEFYSGAAEVEGLDAEGLGGVAARVG